MCFCTRFSRTFVRQAGRPGGGPARGGRGGQARQAQAGARLTVFGGQQELEEGGEAKVWRLEQLEQLGLGLGGGEICEGVGRAHKVYGGGQVDKRKVLDSPASQLANVCRRVAHRLRWWLDLAAQLHILRVHLEHRTMLLVSRWDLRVVRPSPLEGSRDPGGVAGVLQRMLP